ncbi:MAG: hypothetical protein ACKO58_05580 [Cyanobium sp.]
MDIALFVAVIVGLALYFYLVRNWIARKRMVLEDKVTRARRRLLHDQSPAAMEVFTQASREYYVYLGEGITEDGEITAYIEQRIANDLQESMPHSASFIGEYHDRRTTVNVEKAVVRPSEDSPAEIQKGIMLAITSNPGGSATLPEIMTVVAASHENIDRVLRKLMIRGLVKVTNRKDGSICYILDDAI